MAYKRIIGVLTVKDGQLVKSYGYSCWRPAGKLYSAMKMLDRWAVDEIVVLDISRKSTLDARVLEQIQKAKISTPLAYGGGIRSRQDILSLMHLGCDRFVVESVLFSDPKAIKDISIVSGVQALIGSVPLCLRNGEYEVWRPRSRNGGSKIKIDKLPAFLADKPVSEYLITAVDAEGSKGSFPVDLLYSLGNLPRASGIWFGGLDQEKAVSCLDSSVTSAVAFGNMNHELEITLPNIRKAVFRAKAGWADLRRTRKC